jgi:hypothetical protein
LNSRGGSSSTSSVILVGEMEDAVDQMADRKEVDHFDKNPSGKVMSDLEAKKRRNERLFAKRNEPNEKRRERYRRKEQQKHEHLPMYTPSDQ